MSVNLRDRLFNDTGGVIQGATVQALLVAGGGTNAGTSSVVQATTTTDINGVWAFSALPDPGAGNWYDVKIVNGNQVRWRYGNIQASLDALLMSNTSYQISGLGIGTAPVPNTGILHGGTLTASSGGAISQALNNTLVAAATFDVLYGLLVENTYNPNAQTGVTAKGIAVNAVTGASDNNIGIDVAAPSGGTLSNIGVRIANMARALEIGTNPAQTQMINLPNSSGIGFRNFANNGDLTLGVDNSNRLVIGTSGQIWATGGPDNAAATGSLIVLINGVQHNINYV